MIIRCGCLCCLILFGSLSASTATLGADWPQWGGRNGRNMVSDEKNLPARFGPGKRKSNGEGIDPETTENSFAVDDELLYEFFAESTLAIESQVDDAQETE